MNVKYGRVGRVYTAAEVNQIKLDVVKRYEEKKMAVIAASAADQLRVQMHLCLLALSEMGFQKIPLERFMEKVADYTDRLNSGKMDFGNIEKTISCILGYDVDDPNVVDQICEDYGIE